MGAYLHKALDAKIPVVGVAKKDFATIQKKKRPVLRGKSENPLYVTAVGMDMDEATNAIQHMKGNYRIPTALKTLDQLTRQTNHD